jgi:hypothetical protein
MEHFTPWKKDSKQFQAISKADRPRFKRGQCHMQKELNANAVSDEKLIWTRKIVGSRDLRMKTILHTNRNANIQFKAYAT